MGLTSSPRSSVTTIMPQMSPEVKDEAHVLLYCKGLRSLKTCNLNSLKHLCPRQPPAPDSFVLSGVWIWDHARSSGC